MASNPACTATYIGIIVDQDDALVLMQAVLDRQLPGINKKLTDLEKLGIEAGDIFVYIQSESEIQRWYSI